MGKDPRKLKINFSNELKKANLPMKRRLLGISFDDEPPDRYWNNSRDETVFVETASQPPALAY